MSETPISIARVAVLPLLMLPCCYTVTDVVSVTVAVWLTLLSSGTKCVSEEIKSNVIVLSDYYVIDEAHPEHLLKSLPQLTSLYGNNLHNNENVTHGQVAFRTSEAGNYLDGQQSKARCRHNSGPRLKNSVFCQDWELVAKKEKICEY